MPRGRKKDLTISPTRTLVQQRDYRARKALYIANLEERCRQAEEENGHLRKELDEVKGRLVNPVLLLPETAAASSELIQRLSSAKEALVNFNRLLLPSGAGCAVRHDDQSHSTVYPPEQAPSTSNQSRNDTNGRRKELYVDNSLPPYVPHPPSDPITPLPSESESTGECCGGFFDCNELCEDGDTELMLNRTSKMRSTSRID